MEHTSKKTIIRSTAIIAVCFLLTSTGWLFWEYHLLGQISAKMSDVCTMVIGYLLQAAGIGLYLLIIHRHPKPAGRVVLIALILHMIFMVPAGISPFVAGSLIFGFLMNITCGFIAGYYLHNLTANVPANHKALVFGLGYAVSIIASWILSIIDGGSIYYSEKVLIICLVLTLGAIVLTFERAPKAEEAENVTDEATRPAATSGTAVKASFILMAALLVLLFSIVNNSGFAFPSADIGNTVNVELSRLVYAAGLIIAGLVTDKSRKSGAICALAALMIPFIILALKGETLSAVIFWVLSYFIFGFYAVFRIILFSDIASKYDMMVFAGFGLMIGRAGDAIGEGICLLLGNHLTILIILTAVLFVAAVVIFFRLYQQLYVPAAEREESEKERFARFAAAHDLSAREQDMLRLLLEKKSNGEISETLSISENTVKFHVRNLLQKTGCKNRNELTNAYTAWFSK
mgnify:CR=1 FL=1